jgi:adenosylcobinamide-GDP ribazoletransferase
LLDALGAFSIVPVPRRGAPGPAALAALPAVGALLGAASGAAGWAASRVLPAPLGAVAAFGALALLTGAIHIDGFLDGCDAFVASVPPERRLEILKDPRHGTFAVAGMFVAGSASLAALAAIPPARYPGALAFAAALARAAAVAGAFVFPGARAGPKEPRRPHHRADAGVTAVLAGSLALLALSGRPLGRNVSALVPIGLVGALACEGWIVSRLGGLTGDAYGFTIVVLETKLFVALAALLRE